MYWSFWDHNYPGNKVPWIVADIISVIFLILFIWVYIQGKKSIWRQQEENGGELNSDEKLFQRLRVLCVLLMFCELIWSLQFLVSFGDHKAMEIVVITVGSFYDILLPLIMGLICGRVFKVCHMINTKSNERPWWRYVCVTTWVLSEWALVPIMILHFSFPHERIYHSIYNFYGDTLIGIEFFFVLFLADFYYNKIYNMYKHSIEYTHMSLLYQNNQKNLEWLLRKFMNTLLGFIITLSFIIFTYILFLFIMKSTFATNTYWIFIHDITIHNMIHCLLLYYVKADKHSDVLRSSFKDQARLDGNEEDYPINSRTG
ncbi:hypothetical protein RFI_00178, partial [Reticulomyxa filosa]